MQKNQLNPFNRPLCFQCYIFFGYEVFNGLCSVCFNRNKQKKQQHHIEQNTKPLVTTKIMKVQFIREVKGKQQVMSRIPTHLQIDRNKCSDCDKKIGPLINQCKCGLTFCYIHRLPEQHNCQFKYVQNGQKKLQYELIKVKSDKIQKI